MTSEQARHRHARMAHQPGGDHAWAKRHFGLERMGVRMVMLNGLEVHNEEKIRLLLHSVDRPLGCQHPTQQPNTWSHSLWIHSLVVDPTSQPSCRPYFTATLLHPLELSLPICSSGVHRLWNISPRQLLHPLCHKRPILPLV